MPRDSQTAFEIKLLVDLADGGGAYVHSPDVPGLHLIGKSVQAMKPMIEAAVKALFQDNLGRRVNVIWLADVGDFKSRRPVADKLAVYPVQQAA